MSRDNLTRWTAFAAVLAVAAIAALISYRHAVGVVVSHGEPGAVRARARLSSRGTMWRGSNARFNAPARSGSPPPAGRRCR